MSYVSNKIIKNKIVQIGKVEVDHLAKIFVENKAFDNNGDECLVSKKVIVKIQSKGGEE